VCSPSRDDRVDAPILPHVMHECKSRTGQSAAAAREISPNAGFGSRGLPDSDTSSQHMVSGTGDVQLSVSEELAWVLRT